MNTIANIALPYLQGYPAETLAQVQQLRDGGRLGAWLLQRHPISHGLRTDRALYDYMQALKADYLRGSAPVTKVAYDSKMQVVAHALGTHTTVSRVQGSKLKAKREIRIAAMFKDAPEPFLKMIAVHELAHLREREHNKAFYQLCRHMQADYFQLEFEVRVYLTHLDGGGPRLWQATEANA
jgi:predicted metal-dependent hydrolase